jgi:opacity protein-like surface antigen
MKRLKLSLVSILMLAGISQADDTQKPFYAPSDKSVVYGGLGYGQFNQNLNNIQFAGATDVALDAHTIMLQGGYKYNQYLSFEGRYWYGLSDVKQSGGVTPGTYSGDVDAWGLYLKPTLPIEDTFKVYALLGYGSASVDYGNNSADTDNFSWGFGLELDFAENFAVFADYVSIATADELNYTYTSGSSVPGIDANINVYTFNIGLNYKFGF